MRHACTLHRGPDYVYLDSLWLRRGLTVHLVIQCILMFLFLIYKINSSYCHLLPDLCGSVYYQANLTKLIVLFPAIATVVTVAEILKNNGFAVEKSNNIFSHFPVD